MKTSSSTPGTRPYLDSSTQIDPNMRPRALEPGRVPTPPPLPTRVAVAASQGAPRAGLPTESSLERALGEPALHPHELPLAGYLLARASVGRKVDDPDTISGLRSGQQALAVGIGTLARGRGNVLEDILTSDSDSYVAVQVQRDAVEFLKSAARYQPDSSSGRPTPLARKMARLSQSWPVGFAEQLNRHFPSESAAGDAMDYITKTVAARLFAAGNCGEHARVVADARSRIGDAPAALRIARADAVDHAWTEAQVSAGEKRHDDVMMDAWMRTPAHLREDSHFGSAITHTQVELDDAAKLAWMSGVVSHLTDRLQHDIVLAQLTNPAAAVIWDNVDEIGVRGAEPYVPINLKPEFLSEASAQALHQPALSKDIQAAGIARSLDLSVAASTSPEVLVPIHQAKADLLAQEAPLDPSWSNVRRP
jgi:hypothetical protein